MERDDATNVKALLNARLDGLIFTDIGDIEVEVKGKSVTNYNMRTRYVAYAALIDRHTTTQTLAVAFCIRSQGASTPATTIDKLTWRQLHIRTYTDEELRDLLSQTNLRWDDLDVAQNLPIDPYGNLDDVRIYQDSDEAHEKTPKSMRTYRTADKTVSLTLRAHRPDGLGGNDLPAETTFVPGLELFDLVIWLS